jgi:hypothetical protein
MFAAQDTCCIIGFLHINLPDGVQHHWENFVPTGPQPPACRRCELPRRFAIEPAVRIINQRSGISRAIVFADRWALFWLIDRRRPVPEARNSTAWGRRAAPARIRRPVGVVLVNRSAPARAGGTQLDSLGKASGARQRAIGNPPYRRERPPGAPDSVPSAIRLTAASAPQVRRHRSSTAAAAPITIDNPIRRSSPR